MLKNWRYPKISMFTATGGPRDMLLVVLGYCVEVVVAVTCNTQVLCRGCGAVTCNTQALIY
jgi:hypothetical protein